MRLKQAIEEWLNPAETEPNDRYRYNLELNPDGSEKHVVCEGARYHVVSYGARQDPITGEVTSYRRCSEPNCEINHEHSQVQL